MSKREHNEQEHSSVFPKWVRTVSQPLIRRLALWAVNYSVEIDGDLPSEPSLLVAYPHGEHLNSFLLRPDNITYVAAHDTFFKSAIQQAVISLALNITPISRYQDFSREKMDRELARMKEVVKEKHHILVYAQGTRRGRAKDEQTLFRQVRPGVHVMAQELGVPVYPIGISYEGDYNPQKGMTDAWRDLFKAIAKGKTLPRRQITLRIGEELPAILLDERRAFLEALAHEMYTLAHGEAEGFVEDTSGTTVPHPVHR